mmetsp:Transcript_102283/g.200584  ORF Transcript_102283/g.200584 Transcript_102283/m.200584 type:complete len:213 (+) Transcript_102283:376-1014(+)
MAKELPLGGPVRDGHCVVAMDRMVLGVEACVPQYTVHIVTLLEAHEVIRRAQAVFRNELARAATVPVPEVGAEEVPPEQVVGQHLHIARLASVSTALGHAPFRGRRIRRTPRACARHPRRGAPDHWVPRRGQGRRGWAGRSAELQHQVIPCRRPRRANIASLVRQRRRCRGRGGRDADARQRNGAEEDAEAGCAGHLLCGEALFGSFRGRGP